MKRRLIIAGLAVLAVIVSAGAGSKPEHRYSFRVKPSATSVQLEWVKGCAWQRLSAECPKAPCEFVVDDSGIR